MDMRETDDMTVQKNRTKYLKTQKKKKSKNSINS